MGTRIEYDNISGHSLLGVRLIDYRYRFDNPLALEAFLGAERYELGTPAYGFYIGAGVQYRNVLPGCDIGIEYRYSDSIARDHLLASDPANVNGRPDSFYDINSAIFNISYHF